MLLGSEVRIVMTTVRTDIDKLINVELCQTSHGILLIQFTFLELSKFNFNCREFFNTYVITYKNSFVMGPAEQK